MRPVKFRIENDDVELVVISDIHNGSSSCDNSVLRGAVDYIASHENAYALLNGDLIENATRNSVSDVYNAVSPMQQITTMIELLRPISDKIIAATSGNHENRTAKESGVDVSWLIFSELGILDRYDPESVVVFLSVGTGLKNPKRRPVGYTVYMTHGSGGGRSAGAKVNRLVNLANIVDADIYIHSHTHMPAVVRELFYRADARTATVKEVDKLFVNTASALKYGGYAERASLIPGSNRTPKIRLSGAKLDARAEV